MMADAKSIFHDVAFTLIQSPTFKGSDIDEIRKLLLDNGAVEIGLEKRDDKAPTINLEETTHIIASDIEFTEFSELERQRLAGEIDQRMIPIVKPDWVSMSVAKGKTSHVRTFNADPRFFFSGIDATIADLPEGDKEAICGGILALGGQYKAGLSKLTTHIVALTLDNDKCKLALEKNLAVKIVLPHWFDDCLKLNRRIDETPYLLPSPELHQKQASDPLPIPQIDFSYIHAHPDSNDKIPSKRIKAPIFAGKKFFLGHDLEIHIQLANTLMDIIRDAEGVIAAESREANVLLCQWRDGEEYITASQRGIDVGNLTWLYWMIARSQWASPTKMLLHYPRAKIPIPGMENMLITVSNYGGDSRMYLENLIEASGATFTRAMKMENTHLITAREHSDKCDAAKEWNTHMVNHLWLEETYAKWEVQTVTTGRYNHYPRRTNLMEVVGQTRLDLDAIAPIFFPSESEEDTDMMNIDEDEEDDEAVEHPEPKSAQRIIPKMTVMPSSAAESFAEQVTPRPRGRPPGSLNTPNASILSSSPPHSVISTGSRRAKENATSKLHELIMPDVLQYEKEKKRKGGVTHGGRRSKTPEAEKENGKAPKKRSAPADPEDDASTDGERVDKPKKQKKKEKSPISIYLLLTAHQPWIDNPGTEEEDKKHLREIGIQCIENPDSHMTHLSAPHLVRTEKFVCALARAPIIVNANWVQECLKQKTVVDSKPYLLKDKEGETRLKVDLAKSLSRAKENDGKMLDGLHVYISPGVGGGWETIKRIVEANGGTGYQFKAAKRGTILENKDAATTKRAVLVSIAKDEKLWAGFKRLAKDSGYEPLIYKTDWLLDVAMTQKLVWMDKYALSS